MSEIIAWANALTLPGAIAIAGALIALAILLK